MQVHTPERIRKIQFRVLIIGRANAGKTSILQRVCETTDSPILYRLFRGKEKVILNPSMDRGEHWIDDELIFSNHKGYVFHDSRGIESGSTEELKIVQEFIRRKSEETRLQDRLHAIWYCIPMDNQRPQLDLKFFKDICPNKNVPVIAVFTKFDQFRRNVQIHVEDFGSPNDDVLDVTEKQFREHYLSLLGGARFVRLEKMHMPNGRCDDLIEITVAALKDDVVASMLLAVQSGNLESSVKAALYGVRPEDEQEHKVQECLRSFPYIWYSTGRILKEELNLDRPKPRGGRLDDFNRFRNQVTLLPTIQKLIFTHFWGHHFILAIIFILKHATFLRLSNMSPELALIHAELDYEAANIDSIIQQHLMGSPQEHSVESFAHFIMTTDMSSAHSRDVIRQLCRHCEKARQVVNSRRPNSSHVSTNAAMMSSSSTPGPSF